MTLIFASNIFLALIYHSRMGVFSTFYLQMNDVVNIFVPISYFHLQYSKYFLARERLTELVRPTNR